ncbi:MAG: hypothetical protein LBQ96_03015 [Fusobacteriaceae bacterium]|jgi:hypothetical protein|nr:hypothetical protein [Fusobacteriaceae bacterium]
MFQLISFHKKGVFQRKSPLENANEWLALVGDKVRVIATNPVIDEEGRITEIILTYEAEKVYNKAGIAKDEKPKKEKKGLLGLLKREKKEKKEKEEKEEKEDREKKEKTKEKVKTKEKKKAESLPAEIAASETEPGAAETPDVQSPQKIALDLTGGGDPAEREQLLAKIPGNEDS